MCMRSIRQFEWSGLNVAVPAVAVLLVAVLACFGTVGTTRVSGAEQTGQEEPVDQADQAEESQRAAFSERRSSGDDTQEQDDEPADTIWNDPASVVDGYIARLKSGDEATIQATFGKSDVYTAESISDRTSVAIVTVDRNSQLEETDETVENQDELVEIWNVRLHICTLDYEAISEAAASLEQEKKLVLDDDEAVIEDVELEIANRTRQGEFDIHYDTSIEVLNWKNGNQTVLPGEEFKQAITGGWYKTVEGYGSKECSLGNSGNSVLDTYIGDLNS